MTVVGKIVFWFWTKTKLGAWVYRKIFGDFGT